MFTFKFSSCIIYSTNEWSCSFIKPIGDITMTVAELISKLQSFDHDKEVKINISDDYRDRLFDIDDDNVYFDQYEDSVVIDGTFL